MTDHTPLTDQQLDDIEARTNARRAALSGWINCYSPLDEQEALEDAEAVLVDDVPALVAEVRRLREQLAAAVQCNDCGAVGQVFTGDDGLAYLDPTGQIGHPAAVPAAAEGAER